MKKLLFNLCLLSSLMLAISCKHGGQTEVEKVFKKNPTTIKVKDSVKDISSMSANVKVYSMNNRTTNGCELTNSYRMSIKEVNGRLCTRIDMDDVTNRKIARSVISDGKEAVIYNSFSGKVESRFSLPEEEPSALDFLTADPITGRVNLKKIKTESARLNFDVTDAKEDGAFIIQIPTELVNTKHGERCTSAKVTLDQVAETLNEIEIVTIDDEGKVVTSSVQNVYEEKDGEYIKIGTITILDTQNPNLITCYDEDYPVYESIDDIPDMSDAEMKELQANGELYEIPSVTLGNPADLSNIETVIELYDYVELNNVDDSVFKLLLE